ncbi:MAG: ornithine carbamoyltransferase [Planctomycetota bacterium]
MPNKSNKVNLKGRSLLSINDLSPEEIQYILKTTGALKKKKNSTELKGKTLGMIFQKPSTRTRVSFEVAMYQLGGHALYLSANELQLKRGETVADTARVLSRYVDGIVARVFSHNDVVDLSKYATVPVINALSDYEHPCQALADIFTILEHKKTIRNLKIVYIGDGNNVAHSLVLAVVKSGGYIEVATPKGYEMNPELIKLANQIANKTGGKPARPDVRSGGLVTSNNPISTVTGADVIYTDVWTSMGQEEEHKKRLEAFKGYQLNSELISHAKKDVIIMHCLPAHRGEEITNEVVDSPNSVVLDQAENRLHVQKAILMLTMEK